MNGELLARAIMFAEQLNRQIETNGYEKTMVNISVSNNGYFNISLIEDVGGENVTTWITRTDYLSEYDVDIREK